MSYEPEADANKGLFSGMPGKKMALLVGIIIIGGFFGLQGIANCPFKVGDTLMITYKQGEASVEKYHLKR